MRRGVYAVIIGYLWRKSAIWTVILSVCAATEAPSQQAQLPYDPAAYELAPQFAANSTPWSRDDLTSAILSRAEFEKRRRELDVYYYRIGYTLAFPLPLRRRPKADQLPSGILGKRSYPWMIWLSWDLEERWWILHRAWREFGDKEAGLILQRELSLLPLWDHFHETYGDVGLVTAHIASALSLALADRTGWKDSLLTSTQRAATSLIERDVWPWFEKTWAKGEITPQRLGNIPVITLVRAAQLARVIDSPRRQALEERSRDVLRAWFKYRTAPIPHTEGACYDGYLMDSVTAWLEGLPDREELLKAGREAFRSQCTQWIQMTLPGRPDLHVPLGDDEPEMTQWASALMRLTGWYQWPDSAWLLRRFQVPRMRAAAITAALHYHIDSMTTEVPEAGIHELPNAVTIRSGWGKDDILTIIGLSRVNMGHLQADSGQLILAWRGRSWITDPGYQQYRPGEERNYTLGELAHNAPVINGTTQTIKAAQLKLAEEEKEGSYHVQIDLSRCYKGLPAGATVVRDVEMFENWAVIVRDRFTSLTQDTVVRTSWLGGTHLAWSFRDGWARLSDGNDALWILAESLKPKASPDRLEAAELVRHPGSRGPLTLSHTYRLPDGNGELGWGFVSDRSFSFEPPMPEFHVISHSDTMPAKKNP